MPVPKHRRRGKPRSRWVPPPRHQITEKDRRNDALLTERLHQLFGAPATLHQHGDIDWSWDQYQEAIAQLEAEGVTRPTVLS